MSPTDAPIRTALIGYGFAGKTFHVPLLHATEELTLTHVVSGRPDAVHADLPDVVVVPDVDALLARHDVDLVVIAAPNDQHTPLARTALRTGRHVVVDKPFTLSLAEARELRDLAAETGRVLRVFQNRRFDSDFLGIAELVRSGRLGDVVHLESRIDRFRPTVRDRWREAAVPGGGIWFDLGPHLVDQALLLFGVPERVDADLAALRPGAPVEDWAHCVLQYPGRRVVLQASMLVAGGSPRFAVHGTRGTAVKELPDRQEAQLRAGLFPGAEGWGVDPDPILLHDGEGNTERVPAPTGAQQRSYTGVRDAILGHPSRDAATPDQAVAVMAVLEAAVASAREGRAVEPALTAAERAAFPACPPHRPRRSDITAVPRRGDVAGRRSPPGPAQEPDDDEGPVRMDRAF